MNERTALSTSLSPTFAELSSRTRTTTTRQCGVKDMLLGCLVCRNCSSGGKALLLLLGWSAAVACPCRLFDYSNSKPHREFCNCSPEVGRVVMQSERGWVFGLLVVEMSDWQGVTGTEGAVGSAKTNPQIESSNNGLNGLF